MEKKQSQKVILCLIVGVLHHGSGVPLCDTNHYYDSVIRRCSPCSDICVNAAQQRTESLCSSLCLGYSNPQDNILLPSSPDDEDSKWPAISYIIPLIVVAVVALVVTVKYKAKIKDKCCSQIEFLKTTLGVRRPNDEAEHIEMVSNHGSENNVEEGGVDEEGGEEEEEGGEVEEGGEEEEGEDEESTNGEIGAKFDPEAIGVHEVGKQLDVAIAGPTLPYPIYQLATEHTDAEDGVDDETDYDLEKGERKTLLKRSHPFGDTKPIENP